MSKQPSPARKPLEVIVMFEPNRLAAEHLIDAYRQIVPLRIRATQHARAPQRQCDIPSANRTSKPGGAS